MNAYNWLLVAYYERMPGGYRYHIVLRGRSQQQLELVVRALEASSEGRWECEAIREERFYPSRIERVDHPLLPKKGR